MIRPLSTASLRTISFAVILSSFVLDGCRSTPTTPPLPNPTPTLKSVPRRPTSTNTIPPTPIPSPTVKTTFTPTPSKIDLKNAPLLQEQRWHFLPGASDFTWFPSGDALAVSSEDGVYVLTLPSLATKSIFGEGTRVFDVAMASRVPIIGWNTFGGAIVFDYLDEREINFISEYRSPLDLAMRPDGEAIATVGSHPPRHAFNIPPIGYFELTEVDTGDIINGYGSYDYFDVGTVEFNHEGDALAIGTSRVQGSEDSLLILHDGNNGGRLLTLRVQASGITSVEFSPDDEFLAASFDEAIRIWQLDPLIALHTLKGHPDWIGNIDFSPDGSLLVSGGKDGIIRIWEVQSGLEIASISTRWEIRDLAFSPDGRTLAAVGRIYGGVRNRRGWQGLVIWQIVQSD